uniref:Putative basic tail protein n=1 Tax=Ixodes ricinus TaxID=34613 RepID=A0A0K8RIV1_IXORI
MRAAPKVLHCRSEIGLISVSVLGKTDMSTSLRFNLRIMSFDRSGHFVVQISMPINTELIKSVRAPTSSYFDVLPKIKSIQLCSYSKLCLRCKLHNKYLGCVNREHATTSQ